MSRLSRLDLMILMIALIIFTVGSYEKIIVANDVAWLRSYNFVEMSLEFYSKLWRETKCRVWHSNYLSCLLYMDRPPLPPNNLKIVDSITGVSRKKAGSEAAEWHQIKILNNFLQLWLLSWKCLKMTKWDKPKGNSDNCAIMACRNKWIAFHVNAMLRPCIAMRKKYFIKGMSLGICLHTIIKYHIWIHLQWLLIDHYLT